MPGQHDDVNHLWSACARAIIEARTRDPKGLLSWRDELAELLFAPLATAANGTPNTSVHGSCDSSPASCNRGVCIPGLSMIAPSKATSTIDSSNKSYEERVEASKRKLQMGYERAEAAKKQHAIRILRPNQLPLSPSSRTKTTALTTYKGKACNSKHAHHSYRSLSRPRVPIKASTAYHVL